jgi:hypothetical protein
MFDRSDPGDGARRCSIHNVNYPHNKQFERCLVCDMRTFWIPTGHVDEDWPEKVTMFLEEQSAVAVDELPESVIDLKDTSVVVREEHYFIDSRDVVRSDVRHRLTFPDVVRVGHQLFEIIGYSYTRREYLVELLGVTDEGLAELLG